MARYTANALESDLIDLNAKLARLYELRSTGMYRVKADLLYFVIGCRNGYTAVDLATKEQLARHCCHRNLECGTPRECLAAANEWVLSHV